MTVSLAIQEEIASLRQKARDGTMTLDDARRGVTILRADRIAMPPAKSTTRKQKPEEVDTASLLGELGL